MAIALEGTPTLYEAASGTSVVIPYPSGIQAGEVLWAAVSHTSNTAPTTNPGDGWVLAHGQDTGSASCATSTWYKIADGTETGSVTFTGIADGRQTGSMARFSGVDNANPLDTTPSGDYEFSTTTVIPGITTVTDGCLLIHTMALHAANRATNDIVTLAGTTRYSITTGTGRIQGVYTEPQTTAGATGTRTWSKTGAQALEFLGIMAALRPDTGGAPPAPALTRRVVGISETPSTVGVVTVKTTNASSVRIKASTDSAGTTGVVYGTPATPNANGFATLTVSGLTPDTHYYYRIAMEDSEATETLDTASTIGRLRTAPTGQANFAFNFGSCTNGSDSASLAAIDARDDALFLHLGDFFYADGSGTGLTNIKSKLEAKLDATNHAALFATTPMSYTPSDHDATANNSTGTTDPTAWTNWNTAFSELFPCPATYYTWVWGRVRFIQLDQRSFKSDPSDTDDAAKTSLGATQKQWLKDTIDNSTEQVIVLVQGDPWTGAAEVGDDGWYGFTTERQELADHFDASGKGFVILGGDMHAVAADDGTNAVGNVTVFQAAPFNNAASIKGGPYSEGPYPASGSATVEQYGRVVVTDTGTAIEMAFTGYSSDNTSRVTLTKTFPITTDLETNGDLSGSGTLSGTAILNYDASGNLSGSGELTSTEVPAITASGSLSGSGTLSGVSTPSISTGGSFSSTGTLSAVGVPHVPVAAELSGEGTLTSPTQTPAVSIGQGLSGEGTLSGVSAKSVDAFASLSGSGTLSATASPAFAVTANLGSEGELFGFNSGGIAADLSGVGTLGGVTSMNYTVDAGLGSTGTLSAVVSPSISLGGLLVGHGVLSSSVAFDIRSTGHLSGGGTLTAVGVPVASVIGDLNSTGVLSGAIAQEVTDLLADLVEPRWNFELREQ